MLSLELESSISALHVCAFFDEAVALEGRQGAAFASLEAEERWFVLR